MVLDIEWQQVFQPPFIHEGKGSPISASTFSNKPTLVHLKWRWRIQEYFSCSYFVEVQQPAIRFRFLLSDSNGLLLHFSLPFILLFCYISGPQNFLIMWSLKNLFGRHRCIEQTFGLCGRGKGWDDLGEWHWTCIISYMKGITSLSLMHDTGCLGLVHWNTCIGVFLSGLLHSV